MQAGAESNWKQERHPAYRIPWVGGTSNAEENILPIYPEKDIRLFQSTDMDNSTVYNPARKNLFSELPASATYLTNTSYNKSSQSLSATKYGSHVRKIQNLLQEMEQDEEQRLAQIRRDSRILINPNYDQKPAWQSTTREQNLLPPFDRSGSLGRQKSSPVLNSAYAHELQAHGSRRSYLAKDRPSESRVPYEIMSKTSSTMESSQPQPIELEVPSSGITDVVAELDVPYTAPPYQGSRVNANRQPSITDDVASSFADVDLMIANPRSFYNGHRSSLESSSQASLSSRRSNRSSRSTLIELDASPPNLVAELPTENYQLSSVEQRSIPASRYGDRRFRTLPGEAYPLVESESPSRIEQEPQRLAKARKQGPPLPSKTVHFIQPDIDPRSGLPYTGP